MTEALDIALRAIPVMISIGTLIYAFFATRRKDVDERFNLLDERLHDGSKRMDRHDGRIQALEQTVQSLPGKDHLHQLQLELATMNGSLREMSAVMDGNQRIMVRLETIVSRHEQHLLDGSGK